MTKYSPQFKHNILMQYQPRAYKKGFKSLAIQHKIQGGAQTIKNWYDRWNGTVASLERRISSGRPTLLNTRQVKQYIGTPIRKKNQLHKKINYETIHQQIKTKISKSISLRTIQRYGKERLQITKRRTKKVMLQECKHIYNNKRQYSNSFQHHN